jgi:tetratricopeptide (TPR) repeat protein
MKIKNPLITHWAISLAWATGLLFCCAAVQAQPSGAAPLRSEVLKPLAAAQEALKNNQAEQALSRTREALAVTQLTPAERALVFRTQAVAALRVQNWDAAIEALAFLVTSPEVPPIDRFPLFESLINAAQQKKDHALVVKWARQYLKDGGPKPVIRVVMIQTLSLMGEHQQVVNEMQEKMRLDQAAGHKTSEQELRMLAVSYRQLKDNAGYQTTLRRLLELYPSKAYWAEVIQRLAQQVSLNPRLELDLYRLLDQTDNLEEASEYSEMAQLALKAGLPSEAQRVLNKGFEVGLLGKGTDAAIHNKLRMDAQKKLQEDERGFAQFEQAAQDSTAWAGVGNVYASQQNWTAANVAYAKALAVGGLRREAELRLHYAISLLKSGQKDAARQQLAAVQGDALAVELASLWGLLAR